MLFSYNLARSLLQCANIIIWSVIEKNFREIKIGKNSSNKIRSVNKRIQYAKRFTYLKKDYFF